MKCLCFCYLGLELALTRGPVALIGELTADAQMMIRMGAQALAWMTAAFCLLRGLPVLLEGWKYLAGTLTVLPSLERRFFRMLRYRRAIAAKNYWRWLREAVRLAPRGLRAIWHGNKMYLQGVAVDRLGKVELKPAPELFGDGIEAVVWHARQGHTIVIVSGTLEPLANEAARAIEDELAARGIFLGIRVCATRLEEMDGRWTGKILGEAVFGKEK